MSKKPYKREQGDLELRILKDGRLVMVAPDETLMEIAQALETQAEPEQQHVESHDAETPAPDGE